jgi:protease-4
VLLFDLLANLFRLLGRFLAGPPPEYVVFDLAGSYPERAAPRPRFRPLRGLLPLPPQPEESLEELRAAFDRVARDTRVRGVVVRIGDLGAGMATTQSLRGALLGLRRRGKRVVAYLTTINTQQYYLAAAADEILLPESAVLATTGLRTEVTFLREALDRLGIVPDFDHIAEYKTAADPLLRRSMSPEHREMVEALLDSQLERICADVGASRRLDPQEVRALIDRSPLSAGDALAAGLVDGIRYEDELPRHFGAPGRKASLAPWSRARRRLPPPFRWPSLQDVVAVVALHGTIVPGESRELPLPVPVFGRHTAGAGTITRAFRAAERAPRVRALIFYVESGGGSALASDLIWREVVRIKRQKPVVALLGDVAASGGYYVACGASRIVAQPGTITGSVGVVSGKLVVADFFARHGLHREILSRGQSAAISSPFARFSEGEWEHVRREMREVYERFVGRVAMGRSRPAVDVEAIARGRVWTGGQAHRHGLVDDLGDFTRALGHARELAGIPEDRPVRVVTVRPPRAAGIPAFPGTFEEMRAGLLQLQSLAAERVLLLAGVP